MFRHGDCGINRVFPIIREIGPRMIGIFPNWENLVFVEFKFQRKSDGTAGGFRFTHFHFRFPFLIPVSINRASTKARAGQAVKRGIDPAREGHSRQRPDFRAFSDT
jgi:hypothetical protein